MPADELIERIRVRARDPQRRTDFAQTHPVEVATCATAAEVKDAEQRLQLQLDPLYRRLLLEIGNGGFGPGDGIIGLPGGYADDGRSVVELREQLWATSDKESEGILPLCNWGCGVWSCLDSKGRVLTLRETFTVAYVSFRRFLEDWVHDVRIWDRMFTFRTRNLINPFTGQPETTTFAEGPVAAPIDVGDPGVDRPDG